MKIIDNLQAKTSSGVDGLSVKLLKLIKDDVASSITLIINQSFQSGIFPDQLKIAKVIPNFKKDHSAKLDNYRSISILPAISKVFEKVSSINCRNILLQTNYSVMANMGLGKGIRLN